VIRQIGMRQNHIGKDEMLNGRGHRVAVIIRVLDELYPE
jgi:hypothetical protein